MSKPQDGRSGAMGGLLKRLRRSLGVAALVSALSVGAAVGAPKPRNVIFVLVDDLRFDAMGFLTPGLQTPNIDRLAREGVYFPNAVVTSALCSPSRATLLTGLSSRNHGIVDNNNASETGLTFFPSYLQKAGYQTAFLGKWHMGQASAAPRPGFDHWVSFPGQGTYWPTPTGRLNVDGREVVQKGYITDELTDYAMDWLEHGRDAKKPFFLYLSHKAVHSDAQPAPRHRDQYKDLEIRLPASAADTPENYAGKPMWVRNQRNSWHGVDFPYHSTRAITENTRQVYRTLSAVDDSLGRILAWVDRAGLAKDTAVIFYSDNGFLTGDHGLIDKRNAYEGSIRVPMVVWAPGLLPAGKVEPGMVRNLDMAPAILDLAGVLAPTHFEGRSFLPLATGAITTAAWPQELIYEYYWEWNFPMTPTTFAIRDGRYKYIQYHGVWDLEELYDLQADPDEMTNLIDDPAQFDRKLDLRKRLYRGLAAAGGRHAIPFGERAGPGVVFRRTDGAPAADFPAEWMRRPGDPDLLDGIFPDSRAKFEAQQARRAKAGGEPRK